MASVTLVGVRKIYQEGPGARLAVDGVDLAVLDGEFVVLVGPSGCGQSTTLRMLAGLESISAGTVRIGERVVNDVAAKDRNIAMVFQNYALYPHMTVFENMAFGLKLRREPAQFQPERHVLEHRHVRVQRVVLEHHGDVAVLRGDVVHHSLADPHRARRDGLEPGEHAQRGALATSRRPDEHHELAVKDGEVDPVHGQPGAGALLIYFAHTDEGHAGHAASRRE